MTVAASGHYNRSCLLAYSNIVDASPPPLETRGKERHCQTPVRVRQVIRVDVCLSVVRSGAILGIFRFDQIQDSGYEIGAGRISEGMGSLPTV